MGKGQKELLKRAMTAEWWIVILLFALPFLGYLSHPTILLTGMVGTIHGLWLLQRQKGKPTFHFASADLFVILLALCFFFSGIFSGNPDAFLEGLVRALLMMLYFPAVEFFCQKSWQRRGMLALQFSGGIAAFLGIFQYFCGKAQLKWVDLERFSDIGGRVTGGFENPNVFSVYLLLIIPISLAIVFRENEFLLSKILALPCLCAELLCLVFTWSRGAWLAVLLEILIFFLSFSRRTRRYLVIGIFPALLSCFLLPHNIVNRFQSIGNLNESSIRYRLFVWKGTWRMICDHPLGIGLGYERFSGHYLPYALKGTETVIHTHQILLQIFCELGIFGLLLFLIFLGVFFFESIKQRHCIEQDRKLRFFGGSIAITGALAAGMFDHIWYHHGVFCLFWVMAALAASTFGREKSKKGS